MAKLNLTKIDAARRQIDGAIGLLFSDGDSVPVMTLAHAAYSVLKDLLESQNNQNVKDFIPRLEDYIAPEKRDEFNRYINAPANFLKHADRDPNDVLSGLDEDFVDGILLLSCMSYDGLDHKLTERMQVFLAWCALKNRNLLTDELLQHIDDLDDLLGPGRKAGSMTRKEWIEVGKARLREVDPGFRTAP